MKTNKTTAAAAAVDAAVALLKKPLMQVTLDDMNAMVVGEVMGQPVTRGELEAAFNRVANTNNWKDPIAKIVTLDERGIALTREAVIFFTGSVPTFTRIGGEYMVQAAGYYLTIGA